MSEQITTFLGISALLLLMFAIAATWCDCLVPSYLFVLMHQLAVFTALPFLVYTLFYERSIKFDFMLLISFLALINGLGFAILSDLVSEVSAWYVFFAIIEFTPILLIVIRLPFIDLGEKRLGDMRGLEQYY
jgi:hypothetical protein